MINFSIRVFFFALLSFNVLGSEVQILFTSDMHSYFENSLINKEIGGYATIKTMLDSFKEEAANENLETFYFDIGDFSEGNLFYMSNNARGSFEIMKLLEPDAMVMGNHEWLMGTIELMKVLDEVDIKKGAILTSNVSYTEPADQYMNEHLSKYKIVEVGNKRVALIGVTTQDPLYSWRVDYGTISSPIDMANSLAKDLKKNKEADVVVILSHSGLGTDKEMAASSKYIDLIIGGHSHDLLKKPVYIENKRKKLIPILHIGEYGEYVGRFKLNIDGSNDVAVVNYQPVLVDKKLYKEDQTVAEFVKLARESLNDTYGEAWLNEVLGHSEIPLTAKLDSLTPWTRLITQSIKESSETDCSFFSPGFVSAWYPPGEVTREMVANSLPRFFSIDNKYGWNIWRVKVRGFWLKFLIKTILKWQPPVAVSGISFTVLSDTGDNDDVIWKVSEQNRSMYRPDDFFNFGKNIRIADIKVAGKKIKWGDYYSIGLPEGIVLGGLGISSKVGFLLKDIERTDVTLWEAVSDKVKNVGVITPGF